MSIEDLSDDTKVIKTTTRPDPETGAINPPIQLSSTFAQPDLDHFGKYDYTRSGNPTRDVLEESIAALEHGTRGFAFSTGMAAISTAFLTLHQGDHVIVTSDVYGGTFRLVTQLLPNYGIDYTFVDCDDPAALKAAFKPNTKVVYIETPSNPTLKVTDIRQVVQIAHQHDALVFADNTFMTPIFQKPLDLGVDLVLHSGTKFLAGHSDILAGLIVTKTKELGDAIYFIQNAMGATLGISDCWLLLRGIKTLSVRVKAEAANALAISKWLQAQPIVEGVNYPGLDNFAGHDVQFSQATSGGAVLSFDVGTEDNVRKLVKELKIPVFSVSLGAVETILSYPPKMSHAELTPEERHACGISDGLLRLSVGVEDVEDLEADFQQAFEKIGVSQLQR
ncbi:aminotransferase class V-fold PLP-dependent enzyme [Secundilactobacillus folii]|uniref:cysteine-S-conjugate beta-lyase n=1 Tax=Secundilactobacillus folii TaxID=2678357 RepID=A0A7X2XWW0_9LACO|nr:aminotransferase class V-fold PLP-dependent enzyme [Secundilactobacillus folii]MTV83164.1 aminotransferase class V-fold PLP-dependent enzyme [Secundilactobacillus folii]